jgi:hypothetical protein
MQTKAEKIRWAVDQDGTWLHLLVEDGFQARKFAEANTEKPLRVKLTRWTEKRSLSANAYAWTLLGKLSEKLGIPPEEIYWRLIPDVGGNYTTLTIPLESLNMFRRTWGGNGIGWRVDVIGASGPGMVDVKAHYGSSVYDKAQMARLIDLIIAECKEQGIEYLAPDRLAAMLEEWDEKNKGA